MRCLALASVDPVPPRPVVNVARSRAVEPLPLGSPGSAPARRSGSTESSRKTVARVLLRANGTPVKRSGPAVHHL
jgi:hypothetical protein